MAVYSINQVRQLYVAKELKTGSNLLPDAAVGAILPKADTAKSTLYFSTWDLLVSQQVIRFL